MFCMKNKAPELYYDEKGNRRGYRVGISDGVYGVCPFCGKSYTEEDVKNGDVNFEHIFSRFAAKKAIGEKKVFSKLESEFMVAVHKDCNDKGAAELEKQVSRIINNINKPDVSLTQQDAQILVNYCIKISVFLRYLFLWDDINGQSIYNDEKLDTQSKYEFGKCFYENFDIRLRHVDASAGLWWNLNTPEHDKDKYCFMVVLNDIEISFFPFLFSYEYNDQRTEKDIFINRFYDKLILLYGKEYSNNVLRLDYIHRQRLPWKLEKKALGFPPMNYKQHIDVLSGDYDNLFWVPKNYFIRQKKLSVISKEKFEEIRGFGSLDKGVIFCRNDLLYFVDDNGVLHNMTDLPTNTEIPGIHFQDINLLHFPDISKLKITGDIRIIGGTLESLDGCPEFVAGYFYVWRNKIKSLHGAPKYVGRSFCCDSNELISLEGVQNIINEDFSCANNKLQNLVGGPAEVKRDFVCKHNQLTSLEGAPRKVGGNFYGTNNPLKSLQGAPEEIGGFFSFDAKDLKSLKGLPKANSYLPAEALREFYSVDELQTWFNEYKKQIAKNKLKEMRDGAKVVTTLNVISNQNNSINISDDQHKI